MVPDRIPTWPLYTDCDTSLRTQLLDFSVHSWRIKASWELKVRQLLQEQLWILQARRQRKSTTTTTRQPGRSTAAQVGYAPQLHCHMKLQSASQSYFWNTDNWTRNEVPSSGSFSEPINFEPYISCKWSVSVFLSQYCSRARNLRGDFWLYAKDGSKERHAAWVSNGVGYCVKWS